MLVLPPVLEVVLAALLVAAGIIDARTRRFPNPLAAALAGVGALGVFVAGGVEVLLAHLAFAAVVAGALVAFELAWRHVRSTPGLGMGDVKALGALMLVDPVRALAAFAGALVALGASCIAFRRRSLPLLPYLAFCWIALAAVPAALAASG